MKRMIIASVTLLLPAMMMAQPASIRHLLRSCDTGREVTRIHLPPVVIRVASWLVDEEDARKVLRNVNCLYLLVSEGKEYSRQSDFPAEVSRKLMAQNFQEMLAVNDKGEKVKILLREKSRNRKELVIAVDGDEDVVIYLRGKLDLREILDSQNIKIS